MRCRRKLTGQPEKPRAKLEAPAHRDGRRGRTRKRYAYLRITAAEASFKGI